MFRGTDGQLVIEAESTLAAGNWARRNVDGQVAMLWDAPRSNYGRVDPNETISYDFTTDENGQYYISLHSGRIKSVMNPGDRYENGVGGEERRDTGNDIYFAIVDIDTGNYVRQPTKLFTGLGPRDEEAVWGTRFDPNGTHFDATVNLQAGNEYRIEITGRSDGYFLDKIVLNKDSFERPGNDAGVNALVEAPFEGTDGRDVYTLRGGDGERPYDALRGNDNITGSNIRDDIFGGQGNDFLKGGGGNDRITDTLGNNRIEGGNGADRIDGGIGELDAFGGAGNDIIIGGIGNDRLTGGSGSDFIQGDPDGSLYFGNDVITAGTGRDYLEGGRGADIFVFTPGDGVNTIADIGLRQNNPTQTQLLGSDFQSGIDKIDLSAFGFTSVDQVFARINDVNGGNTAHFSHQGTEIYFHQISESELAAGDFII